MQKHGQMSSRVSPRLRIEAEALLEARHPHTGRPMYIPILDVDDQGAVCVAYRAADMATPEQWAAYVEFRVRAPLPAKYQYEYEP